MWNYIKRLFGFGQPIDPCSGSKLCQVLAQANAAYESLPSYSVAGTGLALAVVGAGYLMSKSRSPVTVIDSVVVEEKALSLVATRVAQAQNAMEQSKVAQSSAPKNLGLDSDESRSNFQRARYNAAVSSNSRI